MSGQNDVVMDDAAVGRHGQDVDRVLNEDSDVVDSSQQQGYQRGDKEGSEFT